MKKNHIEFIQIMSFALLIFIYFFTYTRINKIQRDMEHVVVMLDLGVCEGAE